MWPCMHVYRSTCIRAHACVCMCLLSLRIFYSFLPFFLRHSPAKLAKLISWSTSPRNSLVSALQGLEIQANTTIHCFIFFSCPAFKMVPRIELGSSWFCNKYFTNCALSSGELSTLFEAGSVSCSSGWPQTHCVAKDDRGLLILESPF